MACSGLTRPPDHALPCRYCRAGYRGHYSYLVLSRYRDQNEGLHEGSYLEGLWNQQPNFTFKYTIRLIVCQASCHLVTWSLCHSVTRSHGHSVTRSLGHSVTRSLSHSVFNVVTNKQTNKQTDKHVTLGLPGLLRRQISVFNI